MSFSVSTATFFSPLWRMGRRCSSAETQVCHRSYIIAASFYDCCTYINCRLSRSKKPSNINFTYILSDFPNRFNAVLNKCVCTALHVALCSKHDIDMRMNEWMNEWMKSTCFDFKLKRKKQVLALVLIEDLGFPPLVKRRSFSHSWKKSQIFNRDSCKNILFQWPGYCGYKQVSTGFLYILL